MGGHFSNRTPSFLLLPLRVWLGAVWLFEGIMKGVGCWFESPKLTGFFGGATAWYNSIIEGGGSGNGDSVSGATGEVVNGAADAVSAATGAEEAVGEVVSQVGTTIFNIDFFGLFSAIFVSGKELAQSALGDFAFKLDVPLMNLCR